MADNADYDGDVFIYRGGRAPQHVTHVRIDKSVDEIEDRAFEECEDLVQVDTHDGIRRVGIVAFWGCESLRRINLNSAVEIDDGAFDYCNNLEHVEFGDRLETVGAGAFCDGFTSLTHLKLPSIITIKQNAFGECKRLTDVELSDRLERIGPVAFWNCERLQRIAIPLKRNLFVLPHDQFFQCKELTTVDLVGGINETVASLHMESWRAEMIAEINRINQVLPNTPVSERNKTAKTAAIQQWMHSVIDKMDHYKAEHYRYVKESITLLELAVWKAKLGEKEEHAAEGRTKKAKVDDESYRRDKRITCGADTLIKNVLPFLQLE